MLLQQAFCDMFKAMMKDPSYAAYAMFDKGGAKDCKDYHKCEVIAVPQIIDTSMGGGWAFPKTPNSCQNLSIMVIYWMRQAPTTK